MIEPLRAHDVIYRGLSSEEYAHFERTGRIKLDDDATYWTTAPHPEDYAYMIATVRTADMLDLHGEVGVIRAVERDEIVGLWSCYEGDWTREPDHWLPEERDYDEGKHPRDDRGRWTSGGDSGGVSSGERARLHALMVDWAMSGTWGKVQEAARAVINGVPRDEYHDDDRYDAAKLILTKINEAPDVGKPLYRGLISGTADLKVGDTFSESLTSWTARKELAADFASGKYSAPDPGQEGGPAILKQVIESDNSKGIEVSPHLPVHAAEVLKTADEWLTSGRYEVVDVIEVAGGGREIMVQRIGAAVASDLKKDYDEGKHPRDERGRWTDSGGGESSSSAAPAVTKSPNASAEGFARINAAVAAIPASHAAQIQNVPIFLAAMPEEFPAHSAAGRDRETTGLFSWVDDKPSIYVAEKTKAGGITFPIKQPEAVAVHEMGHALDHANGWKYSSAIDMAAAADALTRDEIRYGMYWLQDKKETFAELYSALHNPITEGQTYFGGMSRERVGEVFGRELALIRKIKYFWASTRAVEPPKAQVPAGWLVTDDGRLFALLNGMPYEVDVAGTPYEGQLVPGTYADDAALAASLKKQKEYREEDHPRGEHGRWTDAGGGDSATDDAPPKPEEMQLVNSRPAMERVDRWQKQIEARQNELAPPTKRSTAENIEAGELALMNMALKRYQSSSKETLDIERAALNTVNDGNDKLLAAVWTFYDKKTNVASVELYGALNKEARVRALQQVVGRFAHADRIQAIAWPHETDTIAAFEKAGFKNVGTSKFGLAVLMYGKPGPTAQEIALEKAHAAEVTKIAQETATKVDFDPKLVKISDEFRLFEVNGVIHQYAGSYGFGGTGVTIYPKVASVAETAGVTAHEVAHRKLDALRATYRDQYADVMKEPKASGPGGSDEIMHPNGWLKPPYDKKYPVYQAFTEITNDLDQMIKDDGVSNYSREYWAGFKDGKVPTGLAFHETIAEMAKLQMQTGKVPGSPQWKALYKLMEEHWAQMTPLERAATRPKNEPWW